MCPLRHSARATSLAVQQIGPQRTKMAEIRVLDRATTEITEVLSLLILLDPGTVSNRKTNIKRMEPAQHRRLRTNMARMKRPSRSSIIDRYLNHGHIIVWVMPSEEEAVLNVVEGDSSKDLVDGVVRVVVVVNRADDGDQGSVAVGDLDGKTMINLNVFVMPACKSDLSGNSWRKSNSIDCPSCL